MSNDMEEEAWDRNKRQLPALCHGIALTDTEARARADDALCFNGSHSQEAP